MLNWKTSIFQKNLRALYKVNLGKTNETHQVLIQAIFDAFVMLSGDIDAARLEMCLSTATGDWLDYWGTFFGIPRDSEESDEDYVTRMIAEIIEPKVTIPALKAAAARWLNRKHGTKWTASDIEIFEPWTKLLKLSTRGALSGDGRLWSEDYWRYAVIDISLPDMDSWTLELISYLNEIKAAGVKIIWSSKPQWPVVVGIFSKYKVYSNQAHTMEAFTRSYYPGLRLMPPYKFNGADDSFFWGRLSGEKPYSLLNGSRLIYHYLPGFHRELKPLWINFRRYMGSGVSTIENFGELANKNFDDTLIGDMLDLENITLNTEKADSIPKTTGLLNYIQAPFQILRDDMTNIVKALVNDRRYYLDNPVFAILEEEGHIAINSEDGNSEITLDDTLHEKYVYKADSGNFIYRDYEYTSFSWLSLSDMGKCIDSSDDGDRVTLQDIEYNKNTVINKKLKEISTISNLQLPVQIKTMQEG